MKPLNAKERRKAFLTYFGIFLLGVIPICLSIYLYGRVSHVENEFLRENYLNQKDVSEVKAGETKMYKDIQNSANDIVSAIRSRSVGAKSQNVSGEISNFLRDRDFEDNLSKLRSKYNSPSATAADSTLLKVIEDLTESITLLNIEYYDELFDENETLIQNNSDLQNEVDKLENDLKEFRPL